MSRLRIHLFRCPTELFGSYKVEILFVGVSEVLVAFPAFKNPP
jgi:hypothetical protein